MFIVDPQLEFGLRTGTKSLCLKTYIWRSKIPTTVYQSVNSYTSSKQGGHVRLITNSYPSEKEVLRDLSGFLGDYSRTSSSLAKAQAAQAERYRHAIWFAISQ